MEQLQWWLVVGDGNFSFSLDLLRAVSDIKLITSTLNSRSDDPVVIQTVETLERMGVVVLHEVDATQLSQCTYLTERHPSFDVIVFNFPHTGGKSNVKRNRELLRGFFKSAAQFLNRSGEVHVTLCQGQGGTSMDCTKRGYDNSWKIVEMATFANLVLSRVEPFPKDLYPSYSPTGYRGLSKGFSLEGAIRHVFRFPQVDGLHWCKNVQDCYACERCGKVACSEFIIPIEVQDAMHYPLLSHSWHPIVQIKNVLVEQIKKCSLFPGDWMGCTDNPYLQIHQVPSPCIPNPIARKLDAVTLQCSICTNNSCDSHQPSTGSYACSDVHTCHAFFPSLELDLPRLVCHNGTTTPLQLVCSPVVKNVDISLNLSAQIVSHELIGVIPLGIEESSQELELQITSLLDDILNKSPGLSQEVTVPSALVHDHVPGIYVPEWKLVAVGGSRSIAKLGIYSIEMNRYFVFIFFLEPLAMLHFGISDVRLMRSKDVNFSTQFIRNPAVRYVPFCLNCPSYKHDISFWHTSLESCVSTVKQKLSSIVKQTTGDIVVDLSCVDIYHRPDSSDTSYCFRITYNHYDQPLSKLQANALQLTIRNALSRDTEITLR